MSIVCAPSRKYYPNAKHVAASVEASPTRLLVSEPVSKSELHGSLKLAMDNLKWCRKTVVRLFIYLELI